MKKHILILFLLSIITLSAFGQAGSLSQSVYRSRVNDSTTVNGAHASGYGDFYWNNQDTNPGWRVWNGTSYDIGFSAGGNFWKNAGTTTLTADAQILGAFNLYFGADAGGTPDPLTSIQMYGVTTYQGDADKGFYTDGTGIEVTNSGAGVGKYVTVQSSNGPVSISAGTELDFASTSDQIHFTTNSVSRLAILNNGAWSIGGSSGTAGNVLQSNGAGAAPTWVAPSGGGGHTIEEEGTPLTQRTKLNFVGAGVTATDDSGDDATVVTIPDVAARYVIDQATPSTAGGTVTIDMNSQIQRSHVGSASFATPKTFAMSNTTNSLSFQFTFTITDIAAVITVPADWGFTPTAGWSGTTYTFSSTGRFVFGGDWDGTNWNIKVAGPFSN